MRRVLPYTHTLQEEMRDSYGYACRPSSHLRALTYNQDKRLKNFCLQTARKLKKK